METNQTVNQDAPNIHSEHIKDEFYKWFESRGLLAELRAYMRQLMVKALEETNKNGKTKLQKRASTSPKLQAINLLVVDYLFHEDYFYTVSVFASEARILDSLPQYSRYVTESVKERRWDPRSLPRFSQQETEDILDTLHLPPSPAQLRQATDCYLAGRDSLLISIVRTLHSQLVSPEHVDRDEEEVEDYSVVECSYQLWSQEMQELLLMAGIKLAHIRRMQYKWAQTLEEEKQKAKKEAEKEYAAKEAEWQQVMDERLKDERMVLSERQSRVEVREQSLASLAEQLTAVHEDVTHRLCQLQLQSELLDERAAQQESERVRMQERLQTLQTREEHLLPALANYYENTAGETSQIVKEGPRVNDERSIPTKEMSVQAVTEETPGVTVFTQTQNTVSTTCTQTLDVAVTASTQTLDTIDHDQQTSIDSQPDPQLLMQLEEARTKLSELQEENLELRAHILQQRHRIDELTNRAANLSSQLEESQLAVSVLSGRESAVVAAPVNTPPPAPPLFIAPTFGFHTPQRQGGGEESLFVPRPQQASPRPDGRKRPLRFAFSQHPTPTSEESSPTDEVIQNARARIQQLEQESITIQRNYQDFQTRLLTTDSVMFPPLRNPSRTYDPIMRVRRSGIAASLPSPHLPYTPSSFSNQRRPVQTQSRYIEHEVSSDELYDVGRIESFTNSRRIFTQRNVRQFERWKQFKKKFQRRDGFEHNKRALKTFMSNTSSEDDEGDVRDFRRRMEVNQIRRSVNTQDAQQFDDAQNENKQDEESTMQEITNERRSNAREVITEDDKLKETSMSKAPPPATLTQEAESCCKAESTVAGPSKTENNIELDLECSLKLIESVKVLLEAQSIKETVGSTISNGSLAVESLPRDSDNNSHVDLGKTDSSVVTVQNLGPGILNDATKVVEGKENKLEETNKVSSSKVTDLSRNNNSVSHSKELCDLPLGKNQNYKLEEKPELYLHESNPENLHTPTFRLPSPGVNMTSEDLASNLAVTSSDIAELESGDRATTSFTSGSDILRELNPSKTDSSSSMMSAGFGEDSKHSSDFWD